MHCFPTYEDAKRYAALGFDTMPVAASILSDFITPMEALRILKHVSSHVYLLESAKKNGTWGRWSFLGYEPRMEITCIDHVMHIQDLELETWDPVIQLRRIMDRHRGPRSTACRPLREDSSAGSPTMPSSTRNHRRRFPSRIRMRSGTWT